MSNLNLSVKRLEDAYERLSLETANSNGRSILDRAANISYDAALDDFSEVLKGLRGFRKRLTIEKVGHYE